MNKKLVLFLCLLSLFPSLFSEGTSPLTDSDNPLLSDSELIYAILTDNTKLLKEAVDLEENLELADEMGLTPLHYAALWGNYEAASLLLSKGVDPMSQDSLGLFPLDYAVMKDGIYGFISEGFPYSMPTPPVTLYFLSLIKEHPLKKSAQHLQVAELLFNSGDDLTERSEKHCPLLFAAATGNSDAVLYLIDKDPAYNLHMEEVLYHAIKKGEAEVVAILLEREPGILARVEETYGKSPLMRAVESGSLKTVKLIQNEDPQPVDQLEKAYNLSKELRHWGIVNYLHDLLADTPSFQKRFLSSPGDSLSLLTLIVDNNSEGINEYLQSGGEIEATDERGMTLLHMASLYGRYQIVEQLLNAGAELRALDSMQSQPIHYAALSGRLGDLQAYFYNYFGIEFDVDSSGFLYNRGDSDEYQAIVSLFLESDKDIIYEKDIDEWSAIHYAVYSGNRGICTLLLEEAPELVTPQNNPGRESLLFFALYGNSIDMIYYLKERGVDTESYNEEGDTILLAGIRWFADHYNAIEALLKSGSNPNKVGESGALPLNLAIESQNYELIQLLLMYGADPDTPDDNSVSAWEVAAAEGVIDEIEWPDSEKAALYSEQLNTLDELFELISKESLKEIETVVDQKRPDLDFAIKGVTPLHLASLYGRADVVEFLLSKGATVNLIDFMDFTPIHYAALGNNNTEEIARILDKERDLVVADEEGELLFQSSEEQYVNVLELLFESAPEIVDETPKLFESMAFSAAYGGNLKIIEKFLDIKPLLIEESGIGLLGFATFSGQEEAVDLLIKREALKKDEWFDNYSLLYLALVTENKLIVETLLEAGADPNRQIHRDFMETPLHQAVNSQDIQIVELLLKYGADPDIKNYAGYTAWDLVSEGDSELLDILTESTKKEE